MVLIPRCLLPLTKLQRPLSKCRCMLLMVMRRIAVFDILTCMMNMSIQRQLTYTAALPAFRLECIGARPNSGRLPCFDSSGSANASVTWVKTQRSVPRQPGSPCAICSARGLSGWLRNDQKLQFNTPIEKFTDTKKWMDIQPHGTAKRIFMRGTIFGGRKKGAVSLTSKSLEKTRRMSMRHPVIFEGEGPIQ